MLVAGSGAVGVALFDFWAVLADKLGVLQRIRHLIYNEPEDTSDMAAVTRWLELVVLLPIGILAIIAGYAQLGN